MAPGPNYPTPFLNNQPKIKVMNKTVNINLGGMFFHIDEDAYQKLTRYFDAIKRSLTNANGKDEIIKDIEMRIAELSRKTHQRKTGHQPV
jgi:hypothetical protein